MGEPLVFVSEAISKFSNSVSLALCNRDGNVIFSPCGLFTVLSMVYQATGGDIAKALKATLHVTDIVTNAEECKELISIFDKLTGAKFCNVCNIALREDINVKREYADKIRMVFETLIIKTRFSKKSQAENQINGWLEKSSNSKLRNIVKASDYPANSDMVIVSGLYFKSDWMHRFDMCKNAREDFYLTQTQTTKCAMAKMQGVFMYADRDDLRAQVVCMAFKNPVTSLLVVLPRVKGGLKELEGKLFRRDLTDLYDNLANASVVVTMPKLKLENTIELVNVLKELGVGDLFTERANFENMMDMEGVKVNKILQKVYFETGEQGEIAIPSDQPGNISTTSETVTLSGPSYNKYSFCANHPFIFIVCFHDKCFLPLIVGRYVKPK